MPALNSMRTLAVPQLIFKIMSLKHHIKYSVVVKFEYCLW